jgi:hypothetical protein
MKYKLVSKGDDLFVDVFGKLKKVIKGFESFGGWYWFAFEIDHIQDSDMGNGQVILQDKIYFGLVQGFEEELGYFSEGEILALGKSKVWALPKNALAHSGRRD